MRVTRVSPTRWDRIKTRVIEFVATHKDRHITKEASDKLKNFNGIDLEQAGTLVLLVSAEKRLLGVLACQTYGEGFSIAVVRRGERSRGVGKLLLRNALNILGKMHVEIASDNVPSIKLAFACGLLGYGAFVRDNGQVVLRLKTFEELA